MAGVGDEPALTAERRVQSAEHVVEGICEFAQFVETNYPSILKNIAAKKALDDGIKAEIKTAVEAFKERFTVAAATAAT